MSIISPACCAPTRTRLTMLRSNASCHSLAMVTVSPTMPTSLHTRVAVLAAKLHTRMSYAMLFKEAADAVLCLMALDVKNPSLENDLAAFCWHWHVGFLGTG